MLSYSFLITLEHAEFHKVSAQAVVARVEPFRMASTRRWLLRLIHAVPVPSYIASIHLHPVSGQSWFNSTLRRTEIRIQLIPRRAQHHSLSTPFREYRIRVRSATWSHWEGSCLKQWFFKGIPWRLVDKASREAPRCSARTIRFVEGMALAHINRYVMRICDIITSISRSFTSAWRKSYTMLVLLDPN